MRLLALGLVLLVAGYAAADSVSTPLPPDLTVQAPASSVPKEIAGFSGKWVGNWDGTLDGTLVVEQIQDREAIMIYSWGTAAAWGINRPGFQRVRGTFGNDNVLRATLGNGAKVSYTLNPSGTLNGQYELRGAITPGLFKRADK